MPHVEGLSAEVERICDVVISQNIFGGFDANVFQYPNLNTESATDICIGIDDPWIKHKLGLDGATSTWGVPVEGDVLLWCVRFADEINWYKVTYGHSN